jgi:hypothetical protein
MLQEAKARHERSWVARHCSTAERNRVRILLVDLVLVCSHNHTPPFKGSLKRRPVDPVNTATLAWGGFRHRNQDPCLRTRHSSKIGPSLHLLGQEIDFSIAVLTRLSSAIALHWQLRAESAFLALSGAYRASYPRHLRQQSWTGSGLIV